MTAAVIIYVLLLIIFLAVSMLILRHAIKFGYLSPRFKIVVWIFATISIAVIIFSIFLLLQIGEPVSTNPYTPSSPSSSSGLNF